MQMQFSMRKQIHWSAVLLAMLIAFAPPAPAQDKGSDKNKQGEDKGNKGKDKGEKAGKSDDRGHKNDDKANKADLGNNKSVKHDNSRNDKVRSDNSDRNDARADRGRFVRNINIRDLNPAVRRFAMSDRAQERVAAGALAHGMARGLRDGDVVITPSGNRVHLVNRSGVLLVDLDDAHARNLGTWRVQPLDGQTKNGAPSFCRSGAGHPVWGRQWCLDKGFGLANTQDHRWGVVREIDDIDMRHVDSGSLARAVLIDVLGNVVFNRLGLHAVTLGYTDPLVGTWMGDGSGARVLRITSGGTPIAEIIDADRDNRADNLIVALRPW